MVNEFNIYERLINKKAKLCVIGLGYVGLPIALEFAKHIETIGFDINKNKVNDLKNNIDPTKELDKNELKDTKIKFTSKIEDLKSADFYIVAVPTPINMDKTPDLTILENVSLLLGKVIKKGSYVVFESTVYPGVTEEVCLPIIERESGLKCISDFKIGYSPERINPGDKVHTLTNITKVVSGIDEMSLENIANVYEIVVKAGVHKVSSLKVAEATKVVENSQRDINIAFMNEISLVFDKMNIDTFEVIEAMNTKWNALKFYPGLVGGHCIGVDPYYFIYKAENIGLHSQIILSGRQINDSMSSFISQKIINTLIKNKVNLVNANIAILGITFKENTNDIRNSKVADIVFQLKELGVNVIVVDPLASSEEVIKEYNLKLVKFDDLENIDCFVFAVSHNEFKTISKSELIEKSKNNDNVFVFDIKHFLNKEDFLDKKITYMSL